MSVVSSAVMPYAFMIVVNVDNADAVSVKPAVANFVAFSTMSSEPAVSPVADMALYVVSANSDADTPS